MMSGVFLNIFSNIFSNIFQKIGNWWNGIGVNIQIQIILSIACIFVLFSCKDYEVHCFNLFYELRFLFYYNLFRS